MDRRRCGGSRGAALRPNWVALVHLVTGRSAVEAPNTALGPVWSRGHSGMSILSPTREAKSDL